MKIFKILSLVLMASLSSHVFAEGIKVGVVDFRKIIATSPKSKEIGDKLKQEFKPREDEILKLEKSLKDKSEKLQRNASIMSEVEKNKLDREVVAVQRDLQRLQYEYREDTSLRQREEMQKFMEQLQVIIEAVATEQKFDLVIQNEVTPFTAKNIDITDLILKQMASK